MYALIVGIIILVALLLVLVVLAQNPKGGGLSSQFGGGGGASQIMGVKKTGDILERLTWGFAIALLLLTLSTNFFLADARTTGAPTSPNIENARDQSVLPPTSFQPTDAADNSGLQGLETDGGLGEELQILTDSAE